MLVPLETLSGWPEAPDPTALEALGLLIGFPALVFVIVFAIAKIGTVAQASSAAATPMTDPVWVGGRETAENVDTVSEDLDDETASAGDGSANSGGGAGARW